MRPTANRTDIPKAVRRQPRTTMPAATKHTTNAALAQASFRSVGTPRESMRPAVQEAIENQ
eukprot:305378-Alexandrium_andersonii.AAC.1